MSKLNLKHVMYWAAVVMGVLWTLLVWAAYALLGLTGEAAQAAGGLLNAYPDVAQWVGRLAGPVEQLGSSLLLALWALGIGALLLGVWVGRTAVRVVQEHSYGR